MGNKTEKRTGKKTIICERCGGVIEYKGDVVITTSIIRVVPYHDRCFAREVKGLNTIFVNNTPINGTASNIGTVLAAIFGFVFLFVPDLRYVTLVLLIPIAVRSYAWLKIERHLK